MESEIHVMIAIINRALTLGFDLAVAGQERGLFSRSDHS